MYKYALKSNNNTTTTRSQITSTRRTVTKASVGRPRGRPRGKPHKYTKRLTEPIKHTKPTDEREDRNDNTLFVSFYDLYIARDSLQYPTETNVFTPCTETETH